VATSPFGLRLLGAPGESAVFPASCPSWVAQRPRAFRHSVEAYAKQLRAQEQARLTEQSLPADSGRSWPGGITSSIAEPPVTARMRVLRTGALRLRPLRSSGGYKRNSLLLPTMCSCQVSLAEPFLGKIIRASWVRVLPSVAVCSAVSSQTWSILVLETVNMGGGPMAEVVTVQWGNVSDELDAAKEFLFSADAVTAKHDLCRPRTLEEVRQYL
jgi:hypothetical protein